MKETTFLPLLAPNQEIDINKLSYPLLGSYKLDGCRLLPKDGRLVTRSLKNLPNKQLNEKFEFLRKFSETNVMPDGEIYAHGIPFQFIVSCFMTQDYTAKSAIKNWEKLCVEHDFNMSRQEVFDKLKFYCFDVVYNEEYSTPFEKRYRNLELLHIESDINNLCVRVDHKILNNPQEVEEYFQEALENGYEGLILRNPTGIYKFDRASIKQNIIFKYKPFVTTDTIIKGITQATQVNADAEKTVNEKGRSVTSKKAGDRHLIEKAQGFIVEFEGKELTVPIAMTDEQKKYIWTHQEEYVGKYIEYKYMAVGMKDVPRIPKFVRMRPDKN